MGEVIDLKKLAGWVGEHIGSSSKAIFLYMVLGKQPRPFDAPSDQWDRARCVELLKACPEWVERLSEIEALKLEGRRSVNGSGFQKVYPWNEQIPLIKKAFEEELDCDTYGGCTLEGCKNNVKTKHEQTN